MERAIFIIFWIGGILLPFSTSPSNAADPFILVPGLGNVGVVHFGVPFFALASILILFLLSSEGPTRRVPLAPAASSAIYVGCILLFSLFSPSVFPSLSRAAIHALGFVLFLFVVSRPDQMHSWKNSCLPILTVSGLVLAIYFILTFLLRLRYFSVIELLSERFVGGAMALPWGASNSIASALLLPFIACFVQMSQRMLRTFAIVSAAIIFGAILLTLSRNSLFCVGLFVTLYLLFVSRLQIAYTMPMLLVAVAAYIWASSTPVLDFVVRTRVESDTTGSFGGRIGIWQDTLDYVLRNPFEPVGYYGSVPTFGFSAHNWFLATYVELGPVGLVAGIIVLALGFRVCIAGLRSSLDSVRRRSKVLLLGLFCILVNWQFEDPQFTQLYILYFWIFLGLLFSVSVTEQREQPIPNYLRTSFAELFPNNARPSIFRG